MLSCYLFNIFCLENIAFIFQPILNTENGNTDENYVSKDRHPSRVTDFVMFDKRDLLVTCVTPDRPRKFLTAVNIIPSQSLLGCIQYGGRQRAKSKSETQLEQGHLLQVMESNSKGNVMFFRSMRCLWRDIRELEQLRRQKHRRLQKKREIGLMIKTTALHVHHAF